MLFSSGFHQVLGLEDHPTTVKWPSQHTVWGTRAAHMTSGAGVELDHRAEVCHQVILLLPHGPLWKETTRHSPHVRGQEPRSIFSRTEDLHKSLGIFLHERLCLTPCIYLCNPLRQRVLMGTYTVGCNPTLLYLLGCLNLSSFGGRELFEVAGVSI